MNSDGQPDRSTLAEDRTDLAEDRTLLANERTFSGWARTAMASLGIGIGFNALFGPIEPTWVPKAIATIFFLLAIFLIVAAERRADAIQGRLTSHAVTDLPLTNFGVMAVAIGGGAVALIAAIWWLA